MQVYICKSIEMLGREAGKKAEEILLNSIKEKDSACLVLATGTSQLRTLECLTQSNKIDWSKVSVFHLDEYIGLPETHPASFRRYIKENFLSKVKKVKDIFFINGDSKDPYAECTRLNSIIANYGVDVTLVGIGENGHLAFNDPPANFDIEYPFIVVELDKKCRLQQVGEGWFKKLEDVPSSAISMSIKQITKSRYIICSVPEKRKAEACKNAIEGKVTPYCPASILQLHKNCYMYLDIDSSSLLKNRERYIKC